MELNVKIVKVLEPQSFVSQKNGNTYTTHVFIGETSGQYPRRIAFRVLSDERYAQMGIVVGGSYNISFDIESREWQGRWFTECQAWRSVRVDGNTTQSAQGQPATKQQNSFEPQPPTPKPSPVASGDKDGDDLPF